MKKKLTKKMENEIFCKTNYKYLQKNEWKKIHTKKFQIKKYKKNSIKKY